MLNCNRIKELLESYHNGELTDTQKQKIETHLLSCDNCRAELESLKRLEKILQGVKFDERSDEFWARYTGKVRNKIADANKTARRYRLRIAAFAGALSTAAAVLLVILINSINKPVIIHPSGEKPVRPLSITKTEPVIIYSETSLKISKLLRVYATLKDDSNRKDVESEIIENIGDKAAPYLVSALRENIRKRNKDYGLCNGLIRVLGCLKEREAVYLIAEAMDDEQLRVVSVDALDKIRSLSAIPCLVKWYSDTDIQTEIVRIIRQQGKDAERQIVSILRTGSPEIKINAIKLSGDLKIKTAIPALAQVSTERKMKLMVIEALGNIGSPEAIPILYELAKDPNVFGEVCNAVKKMGGDAIPYLTSYFNTMDSKSRQNAFEMLTQIEDKRTLPYLISALSERKLQTQAEATLRKITNQDFGTNQREWWKWLKEDSEQNKDKKSGYYKSETIVS